MGSEAPKRFVIDTNTLVSAFLFPSSIPGQVFEFIFSHHCALMSMAVVAELADVLRREKFDRYVSRRRREELIANTIRGSEFVDNLSTITVCRDATDNKFLELAVDGKAEAIVTGDVDLLLLNPFQGIPILTPRDFLLQFAAS